MSGPSTYQPKTAFTRWLDTRLPIMRLAHDSFIDYPTPRNLNYWYTFGGILTFCLITQIVSGIVLAMHYNPSVAQAFASVQRIERDVPYGWLIQNIHAVGASMFFLAVYIHMFRGLYYGSYKAPREVLWILGCVIYVLMVGTAFMGYVLPWGQMSFWGATVITGLIGAIPVVGPGIQTWLMGSFVIDNATLNRFFSLHYLLPFVIFGVVILHVWALHVTGQNNPDGVEVKSKGDTVPFTPFATSKDLFALSIFVILFATFVFYMPDALGHADNFIPANPLQTPPEIVPEWYLLPFYAILRAIDFNIGPIDSKLGGVIAMFGALAVLFVLPWLDTSKVRSMRYRPVARQFFFLFVIACLALGWAGGQNPALSVYTAGEDRVTVRWFEGSEVRTEQVSVSDSADLRLAMANAEVALRDQGAVLVLANATGQTSAEVQGVFGGTERSEVLGAKGVDEANAMAAELLAGLPSGGVAEVTPQPAFRFTVTMLSQLLTAYYFAFFLLILPLLGLREQPSRVPDTIAKAVAAKAVPATAS